MAFFLAAIHAQQDQKPIGLQTILDVLALPEESYSSAKIVSSILQYGVDFELTDRVKAELQVTAGRGGRNVGDVLTLVQAIDDSCAVCPAMSKAELLRLLSDGLPSDRVQQRVLRKRVTFLSCESSLQELKRAGATETLLQMVKESGRPCEQITQPEIIGWLKDGVTTKTIFERVRERGIVPFTSDSNLVSELVRSGASYDLVAFVTGLRIPDSFRVLPSARARAYDENSVRGWLDLSADIDHVVDFRWKHWLLCYLPVRGQPISNVVAEYSQPLPKLPLDSWELSYQVLEGLPKSVRVTAAPPDSDGYPSIQIVVNDEPAGHRVYRVRIDWALRPFSVNELLSVVKACGACEDQVSTIEKRGVGFRVNDSIARSLQQAGASDSVVRAITWNFRESNR